MELLAVILSCTGCRSNFAVVRCVSHKLRSDLAAPIGGTRSHAEKDALWARFSKAATPHAHACEQNGIEHRLTKPRHPWTTDEVEQLFSVGRVLYSAGPRVTARRRAGLGGGSPAA